MGGELTVASTFAPLGAFPGTGAGFAWICISLIVRATCLAANAAGLRPAVEPWSNVSAGTSGSNPVEGGPARPSNKEPSPIR